MVSRMVASPSRSSRRTCTNLPTPTASPPDDRATASGEHVVRARRVVAGRFGAQGPRTRARVAQPRDRRFAARRPPTGARDHSVDEVDRGVEVWRERDATVRGQGGLEDVAAGAVARRSTSVSTASANAASVVTRIAGESGPCSAWVMRSAATRPGSAAALRGPCPPTGPPAGRCRPRRRPRSSPRSPRGCRADDAVHRSRPVSAGHAQGADRLGSTGDDECVHPEEPAAPSRTRSTLPAWSAGRRRRSAPRRRPAPGRRSSSGTTGTAPSHLDN